MLSSLLLSRSVRLGIIGAGLVLGACGGSTSTPSDEGTTTTPGATTTPTPTPTTTSTSKPTPTPTATATTTPTATPTTTPTVPPNPKPPISCNAVTNDAVAIGAQMVPAVAPSPTGGAVANGKYHLTDVTLYTGPGGGSGPIALSIQQTLMINGNTVDVIQSANGKVETATEMFTTSGTTASFTRTCPSAQPAATGQYSISGGTLVWFLQNDPGQTVAYTYAP